MKKNVKEFMFRTCALSFALLLTAGCSTIENAHRQKESMVSSYLSGNFPDAKTLLKSKLESAVGTGDELMWRLEAGSLNFSTGCFQKSIDEFRRAEELISDYENRARVSARNLSSEGGAAFTNPNALPYRGFCRDKIVLSIYKSFAYLGVGNESAFRAQLRRMRDEQKKVLEAYLMESSDEKKELDRAREENPDAAKKAFAAESSIGNSPDNTEFRQGIEDVKKYAALGYSDFLNPAAIFLSGLSSVRDGNWENARIEFERLYKLMPDNKNVRLWYVTSLKKMGRSVPRVLSGVRPFDFPPDRDCVYVFVAHGRSVSLRQIAVYFPFMVAWPMCEFYASPGGNVSFSADGKTYFAEKIADMDGIFAREFQERMPGMITRIALSTLIKEGAYYGGLAVIAASDLDPVVKAITFCAVAVAGAGYRTAMNTADTRTWELLPKDFRIAQFPVPKNRKIRVTLPGRAGLDVKIPSEARSAVLFVNVPSSALPSARCFVLPIPSK